MQWTKAIMMRCITSHNHVTQFMTIEIGRFHPFNLIDIYFRKINVHNHPFRNANIQKMPDNGNTKALTWGIIGNIITAMAL